MRRYHRNLRLYYLAAHEIESTSALNQGAAAGALVVVMKLIAYLLGVDAYMSTTVAIGSMVFVIAGMCIACMLNGSVKGDLTFRVASELHGSQLLFLLLVLVFELILFGVSGP